MPAISVIVPVYKVEKYIHRCVDSILNQIFQDFELILVDDGSPDNCGAICDEYATKDSRIVVIHQENGGLSAARNAGIDWAFSNSDSQWLTFIDSDDWVHLEYLQRLHDAAVESNVAVSVCRFERTTGETPKTIAQQFAVQVWSPEDFYVACNVNAVVAWGKLYKKEAFSQIRYPVGRIHEDEFTTHRVLFAYDRIAVIEAPMYFYFQNPTGIMGSKWSPKRLDVVDALLEQLRYFDKNGYAKALSMAARRCSWAFLGHLKSVEASDLCESEQKKCISALQSGMRTLLCRYPKEYPFHQNYAQYELAFPGIMELYWLSLVVLKKLGLRK